MILKGESSNTRPEIYSSASSSNIKLMCTDPEPNICFHNDRQVPDRPDITCTQAWDFT